DLLKLPCSGETSGGARGRRRRLPLLSLFPFCSDSSSVVCAVDMLEPLGRALPRDPLQLLRGVVDPRLVASVLEIQCVCVVEARGVLVRSLLVLDGLYPKIVFAWRGAFCFSSRRRKGLVSSSGLGCFRSWETASLLLVGSCTGFVWSCGYRSHVVMRLHPRRCGKGLSSMAFLSPSHEGDLPLLSSPMYLVELLWLCFVSSLTGPKRSKTETGVLFRIRSSSCSAGWVVSFLLAASEVFYSGLSPSQPVFVFVLNKTRRSSGCVRSLVCRSIHVGLGLGSH
ncbi:hypothetical protein IGI04_008449, partial [Brassica rapa subsp. trilocularis]